MTDHIPTIDSRVTVSADMLTSQGNTRVLARCPELETRLDEIEVKLNRLISAVLAIKGASA